MDKRFLAILATLIIIFGGIFFFSKNSSDNGSSSSTQPTNHVVGSGNSAVKLVEYGDYQCSVCESYESVVAKVRDTYSKKIDFQFRNLPLVQIHPNAFSAARAAEAAGLQGKFWEMHDALYAPSNWQNWTGSSNPTPLYESYAQKLGVNLDQYKQDFGSSRVNDMIQADIAEFDKTGAEKATPTFFLNGTAIENSKLTDPTTGLPSFQKMSALILAELAKTSTR